MDRFSYLITVEVPATGPIEDLAKALQAAYDDGAYGFFKLIVTHQPTYVAIFLRTTAEDDKQYLRARLAAGSATLHLAAMHQLGNELKGSVGELANPIVDVLLEGDAQIVDFNGVLDSEADDE
jgi:hypothetical protein